MKRRIVLGAVLFAGALSIALTQTPPPQAGVAAIYAAAYVAAYLGFLNRYFEYMGFAYIPREAGFVLASFVIAVVPSLCYRGWLELSSVLAVFVYAILYIPVILTFALCSDRPVSEIMLVQAVFMCGMCLLFLADAVRLRNPFDLATAFAGSR